MHMVSSIDGKIGTKSWPREPMAQIHEMYEEIHRALEGDAWLVGRVTMAEFAEGDPKPMTSSEIFSRTTWKAPGAENGPYAVAVDRGGRLHLNMSHANGDPLIAVLAETVSDDHLAELRRDQISYIFAGETDLNLAKALHLLSDDFGIKRLLLEGGGNINGSFLDAGLVDEISLLIAPFADGNAAPSTVDRKPAPANVLKLKSVTQLENDLLHLKYDVLYGK
jgi:riboflavin biosynthesis pyrimidine reductase